MHSGVFSSQWCEAIITPIHKKDQRRIRKTTEEYHYPVPWGRTKWENR